LGHSKGSPKRKVLAMNTHIKKTERSQIYYLMLHIKLLEKQEQSKSKTSRIEIIKIKSEINEIETKNQQRINKTRSWFY
jgi:hypothetical protein